MSDVSECIKKKRRVLLALCGYSLVLIVMVFRGSIASGNQGVGLLLFVCWVIFYVDYKILAAKVEILKTIQDAKNNHKDTTE